MQCIQLKIWRKMKILSTSARQRMRREEQQKEEVSKSKVCSFFNLFHGRFSEVFRGYRKGTMAWNELSLCGNMLKTKNSINPSRGLNICVYVRKCHEDCSNSFRTTTSAHENWNFYSCVKLSELITSIPLKSQ